MASTVFIASPEYLTILDGRAEFGETHAFADADALKALEAIVRQRPRTVVLERTFAGTSRGAALVNRIKADPALADCEIRIVSHESTSRRLETAAAGVATSASPIAPLDQRGTRRAARFRIVDGVEVLIDGNPATLVDLSIAGAQVVSVTILKPNQRVRVLLPGTAPPLRMHAGVAWAAFEIPKTGPRYRAGIEFVDANSEAIGRFIERNKR